jgi:hypothetical protein
MAWEQYSAFPFLEHSDKKKYGSMLIGFTTQYSLGNDQYSKYMSEAVNVLSNHRFDKSYYNSIRKNDKVDTKQPGTLFAQLEGRCYCCGITGHLSPDCPHKMRPSQDGI